MFGNKILLKNLFFFFFPKPNDNVSWFKKKKRRKNKKIYAADNVCVAVFVNNFSPFHGEGQKAGILCLTCSVITALGEMQTTEVAVKASGL